MSLKLVPSSHTPEKVGRLVVNKSMSRGSVDLKATLRINAFMGPVLGVDLGGD